MAAIIAEYFSTSPFLNVDEGGTTLIGTSENRWEKIDNRTLRQNTNAGDGLEISFEFTELFMILVEVEGGIAMASHSVNLI